MSNGSEQRISHEHLQRQAIVYVRQSSSEQVRDNAESTRIQLGLRQKAIALGWPNPVVIDDDLGVSAAGFAERAGFQEMLAQVALRKVGIILCSDASRLSRNSKDWAHLFELCVFFQTLIADLEQIYDLTQPNDRLVMGIKGTMSEMELVILKTRMQAGSEAKAKRGELKFLLPAGYIHDPDGKIVLDPDARIQGAVRLMFQQFERSTSVRQLGMWYRETKTLFPVRNHNTLAWRLPAAKTLYTLLVHPLFAGAYVYGRKLSSIEYVDGRLVRKRGSPRRAEDCRVCIRDHHEAYISWETLLANLAKLADNRPRWAMQENRGAPRNGLALLTGLLRCGHCGSRMHVTYRQAFSLYTCDGGQGPGTRRCLSFGSKLIDQAVSDELCRALAPVAVEAALKAAELQSEQNSATLESARLRLQAARYEAERAFEQYNLVDPKNRLVADNLEKRLNAKLAVVNDAEFQLRDLSRHAEPIAPQQLRRLHELAENFPAVWTHPLADPARKKRILRTAVQEVLVSHDVQQQSLTVTIHWQGGTHTRVTVKKRATPVGCKADPELVDLVRELARELSDAEMARVLNMKKLKTPHGHAWSLERVKNFRRQRQIVLGESTRGSGGGQFTANRAAKYLGISRHGVLGLVRLGALSCNQITDFAPWFLAKEDLDSERVQRLVRHLKRYRRLPEGGCPEGQKDLFL